MVESVGIIGVGHMASYLVEGLKRQKPELEILLSQFKGEQTARLQSQFGARAVPDNQAVADGAGIVIVSTRPADVLSACRDVSFRRGQIVVSTAIGVALAKLEPVVSPGKVIRAMPITCSAINRSPTLLHPDEPRARWLFGLLGNVHLLPKEEHFDPASVIAAYYGWVYALMDTTVEWAIGAGVPRQVARDVVLETTRGAAEMGLAYPERELAGLLDSLATPGGVTRDGLKVLEDRKSLEAWIEALELVRKRLLGKEG